MSICDNCKYNSKGYCKHFKSKIKFADIKECVAFKKVNPKPVKNRIKKKSLKQEKKLAEDIGAKLVPQSGAQDTSPNDMIKGNFIIESKATDKDRITLMQEWLKALKLSPMNMGKIPALIIEFKDSERYVIIDEKDFKFLTGDKNEK